MLVEGLLVDIDLPDDEIVGLVVGSSDVIADAARFVLADAIRHLDIDALDLVTLTCSAEYVDPERYPHSETLVWRRSMRRGSWLWLIGSNLVLPEWCR